MSMVSSVLRRPDGLPAPRALRPSLGDFLALLWAALVGSVILAPVLVGVWYFMGGVALAVVWAAWLVLASVFVARGLANALGRSIQGWREPTAEERAILHAACVRVCVAAGVDPERYTLRVARGTRNAHSSGRSVLAATADVITGPTAVGGVELEAMLAHELAHHRHGDLILAGPTWWLLLPLAFVDTLSRALAAVPLIGSRLALALWFPFRAVVFPFRTLSCLSGRPRELLADRFAADCGYARPLEHFFTDSADSARGGSGGLVAWMLDTHPGATDRITALRNADA